MTTSKDIPFASQHNLPDPRRAGISRPARNGIFAGSRNGLEPERWHVQIQLTVSVSTSGQEPAISIGTPMNRKAKKGNLLIVDDTPDNIDVLVGCLSPDYRTRIATNGKIALSLCEKEVPDLILLDIMMPEMDGYEVCLRLKKM